MRELEAAIKKLKALWEIVERPIIIAFEDVKPAKGGTIISVNVFQVKMVYFILLQSNYCRIF